MSNDRLPILVQIESKLVIDYRMKDGKGEFLAGGRVVAARSGENQDIGESLRKSGLFACPRALGLIGTKTEQGIEALVVVLVQPDDEVLPMKVEAPEPWQAEEEPRPKAIVIGMVLRPAEWCLSADVTEELSGMLRSMVGEAVKLTPEQQAIENLLGSI